MKKYFLLIMIFFVAFLLVYSSNVFAYTDKIDSITMDITIDSNGNASIIEKWEVETGTGTEFYKTFNSLETSEITGFSVSDETGAKYTFLSTWDINATRSEKANKCGINTIDDGVELCWGIGEYGNHTYTLSYTITNFVQQYTDCQATYFTLIPKNIDPSPSKVTITISADFDFDESSTSVQGYGYTGNAKVENGKIMLQTTSGLSKTQYMTISASFPSDTFNTTDKINESFENISETTNTEAQNSTWTKYIPYILIGILAIIILVFVFMKRKEKNSYYYDDNNNIP